jgi:maleate isomerase
VEEKHSNSWHFWLWYRYRHNRRANATQAVHNVGGPSSSYPTTSRINKNGSVGTVNLAARRVGSLARIGVLTPDFDPVPESEMWAMAPHGVSIHAARVTWKWNHDPREFAEAPQLNDAVDQLVAVKPRAIAYAFTSSSYVLGDEAEGTLKARLEKRAGGISVIPTCIAAMEALRLIGAQRIALVHPPWFSEEASAKGKDYFRNRGFEVTFCERMVPERAFTEVPPAEVFQWVKTNVPRNAGAVLIGGNGLRAIGAIQALEESLRRPVLTANQVVLWAALGRLA